MYQNPNPRLVKYKPNINFLGETILKFEGFFIKIY